MIKFLRLAYVGVILTMLAVTGWASSQVALWETPRAVVLHPWFIATLFDTYFAFLIFYAWVAYKETTILARVLWLLAILLLGNIAIGAYMLIQLFRVPANATIEDLLLRKPIRRT
jgi:predicted permease